MNLDEPAPYSFDASSGQMLFEVTTPGMAAHLCLRHFPAAPVAHPSLTFPPPFQWNEPTLALLRRMRTTLRLITYSRDDDTALLVICAPLIPPIRVRLRRH
jgi:hypothetical protein